MIEKISNTEINENSVAKLPTRPNDRSAYGAGGLSSAQLRARMDALALLAIAKYNELVDAIGKSDADGLVSMLPSGIDKKSVKAVIDGIKSGELAGYLTAYDDEAKLKTLQSIITELYERIVEAGDGATYTPHVDAEGNLSWTNDKWHDNPEPINIMGTKLLRTEYVGKNESGDNVYKQIYSDGSEMELIAPKGEGGNDGATPYIKDGTWWIGTENTGVPASGGSGAVLPEGNAICASGSYFGNGLSQDMDMYWSVINVGFRPRYIYIAPQAEFGHGSMSDHGFLLLACDGGKNQGYQTVSVSGSYAWVYFEADHVKIGAYSPEHQMNEEAKEYYYFVVGTKE